RPTPVVESVRSAFPGMGPTVCLTVRGDWFGHPRLSPRPPSGRPIGRRPGQGVGRAPGPLGTATPSGVTRHVAGLVRPGCGVGVPSPHTPTPAGPLGTTRLPTGAVTRRWASPTSALLSMGSGRARPLVASRLAGAGRLDQDPSHGAGGFASSNF